MFFLEILLLVIAYSALIVSLGFALLCYRKHLETAERLALTLSLIFLTIVISASPVLMNSGYSGISEILILSSMIIAGTATLLNSWEESLHNMPAVLKGPFIILGLVTLLLCIFLYFSSYASIAQWLASGFLILSLILTLMLIYFTAPKHKSTERINIDKPIVLSLGLLVPIYLFLQFSHQTPHPQIRLGFLLPVIFTVMAVSKISTDIKKLSLSKIITSKEPDSEFLRYQLTGRETEVAKLLVLGYSYQFISNQLFISVPTVKTHTSNIYRKCEVKSKFELMNLINK